MEEQLAAYQQLENIGRKKYLSIYSHVVNNIKNNPESAGVLAEGIVDKCIEEILLEVVAEFHRAVKLGYDHYHYCQLSDDENPDINGGKQVQSDQEGEGKKTENIKCPNCCTRSVHAARFAPHLEKCMGLGRNSSRMASRRIAQSTREPVYGSTAGSDDEDDDDWSTGSEKSKSGGKKQRAKSRKLKGQRANSLPGLDFASLVTMNDSERVTFLSTTCAVKMDGQKICLKPIKCSTHSDEEKSSIRDIFKDQDVFEDYDSQGNETPSSPLSEFSQIY